MDSAVAPPEHNVTGQDLGDRRHLHYAGPPLIDAHAHVMQTRPEPKEGEPAPEPGDPLAQAATMLDVAAEFGIERIMSMCPPDDIALLRARFGLRLLFNGPISKKLDEPDEAAYRRLDRFVEQGVHAIKFWAAPRGRDRGLLLDTPWRIEAARRARAAGVRVAMVHVADPDRWFEMV